MGKSYGNYDMTDRIIDDDELNEIVRKFSPLVCWKVGLSVGSMIYFDMGDRIKEKCLDGSIRHVGSATLWLNGDIWVIREGSDDIITSKEVNRDFVEQELSEKFLNQKLEKFYMDKYDRSMTIGFSDDLNIIISHDIEDQTPVEEGLMDFFIPDGRILYWNKEQKFCIDDTISNIRGEHWRNRNS